MSRTPLASLTLLLLCGLPRTGHADINVESRRGKYAKDGFLFEADLAFGFRQGNVNLLDLGANTGISYKKQDHLVFLFHESAFATRTLARDDQGVDDLPDRDSRFKNRHLGHLRYVYTVRPWLKLEALTQGETDEFLLVRARALVGGLPRFVLVDEEIFTLAIGSGYIAEYEELDPDQFVFQTTSNSGRNWWHRWGSVLALQYQITDRFSAFSTLYVQPRFGDLTDARIFNETSFHIAITDHFGFRLTASIRHDTKPPYLCTVDIEAGGFCPPMNIRQLVATDVSLDNAFTIRF